MLLDFFAIILLILAAWKGVRKGLVVAVFSFIGFMIGLAAAIKLSAIAAGYIGEAVSISERWLPFIAFFLVFLVVVLVVKIGARLLESAVKMVMLGWANRIGGILFYILIYFFIYSILIFYAAQLGILKSATIDSSFTYSIIGPMAPAMIEGLGKIIPIFSDMFSSLLNFFQEASVEQTKLNSTE
jgi:membrane protein required for colicin V production